MISTALTYQKVTWLHLIFLSIRGRYVAEEQDGYGFYDTKITKIAGKQTTVTSTLNR